jgi:hypothetical protein
MAQFAIEWPVPPKIKKEQSFGLKAAGLRVAPVRWAKAQISGAGSKAPHLEWVSDEAIRTIELAAQH